MAKLAKVVLLVGFSFPEKEGDYFAGYLSTGADTHAMCSTLPETMDMLQTLLKDITSDYPLSSQQLENFLLFADIHEQNAGQEIWWKIDALDAWVEDDVEFAPEYLDRVNDLIADRPVLSTPSLPENLVDISFIANVIVEQRLDILSDITGQQILDGLRDGTYATTLHHGEDVAIPMVSRVDDGEAVAIIVTQTTDVTGSDSYIDFSLIKEDD